MRQRLLRTRAELPRLLPHLALVIGCFELYRHISIHVPRMPALAHQHADALVRLEQRLGILFEPRIQHLALHHGRPALFGPLLDDSSIRSAATLIYTGGQVPWLGALLLWLLLFKPKLFMRLSILAVVGTFLGILISASYPVAPPRFVLTGHPFGMEDVTMMTTSEQELRDFGGYDLYAALPSMHVFWALITGLGLYSAAHGWGQRLLATLFPAAIMATVIVTGNHYILDCVASLILFGACLALYRCYARVRCGWRAHANKHIPAC